MYAAALFALLAAVAVALTLSPAAGVVMMGAAASYLAVGGDEGGDGEE